MFKASKTASAVRLVIAMGAAAVAFSTTAVAQEKDQAADSKVERIQVTGSSIKRTDVEGALPVQTVSRDDIEKSGLTSAGDLIQALPSMQGFTTDADSVGGGGGGVKTASLRGLGSSYTLVLINGRRLAPSGSGSTIDLNAIPLAAIERVEVLTDGASALYGSDAIAGVVNFITKQDYQGAAVAARYNRPQETGGASKNVSLTYGVGDLSNDGYNVLFSVSRDTQDRLRAADRDFGKTGIVEFTRNDKKYYFLKGSPTPIPANADVYYTNADGTEGNLFFNPYRYKNNDTCAPDNFKADTICQFDYASTIEIMPETERTSYTLNGTVQVNDDLKFFAEAMYSDFSLISRIAPNPASFTVPVDAPLVAQYIQPYLPTGAKIDEVDVYWRALPFGNRTDETNTKSTNLVAGFEATVGDFDLSGALTYGKNDSDSNKLGGYSYRTAFNPSIAAAVKDGSLNVFDTVDKLNPTVVAALLAKAPAYVGNYDNSSTDIKAVDFKASTPVFELPGGQAYVGTGVEYRQTHFVNTLSEASAKNLLQGGSKGTPYDMERNNYGGFVEVIAPVLETVEVTGAVRYDNIGGITSNNAKVNDAVNDTTYKLSARWTVTDDIILRASTGTGFKAPSMLEIARPRVEFGVTSGSYDCPFKNTTDPLAKLCKSSTTQFEQYNEGTVTLQPEESDQYTFGFVYSPDNNFSLNMDLWTVNMENLVASVTEAQIFANPTRYRDLFTTKTNPNTGRQTIAIISKPTNVGKSVNRGLDWEVMVGNDLSFGRLTTTVGGTYVLDSRYTRPGSSDDWISSLGRFGDDDAVVFRNIVKATTTLTHGDFTHSLIGNFKSGYEDSFVSAKDEAVRLGSTIGTPVDMQLAVPSYVTWNYQGKYQVNADASVVVGVNNLTDREPPLSLRLSGAGHQAGYDPRYTDSLGRTFYVGFDYKFM